MQASLKCKDMGDEEIAAFHREKLNPGLKNCRYAENILCPVSLILTKHRLHVFLGVDGKNMCDTALFLAYSGNEMLASHDSIMETLTGM